MVSRMVRGHHAAQTRVADLEQQLQQAQHNAHQHDSLVARTAELEKENRKLKAQANEAQDQHNITIGMLEWKRQRFNELRAAARRATSECNYMTTKKHGEVGRKMDALRKLVM